MTFSYRAIVRPAVSVLPPEVSHRLALASLRFRPAWSIAGRILATADPRLEAEVAGLRFPNPVGMAAGFDKDCQALGSLLDIGFGFAVGGTVTRHPGPGNARPRLLRDRSRGTLTNALGFPGKGLDYAEARLRRLPERDRRRVIVSVSGTEDEEVAECHERLAPLAAGIEINISSPNTAGLAAFHEPQRLRTLLSGLSRAGDARLFVKLPRLPDERDVVALAEAAAGSGADGVVVANTLPVEDSRLAVGRGGLSGRPLLESTITGVQAVSAALAGSTAVIACGGVTTAADARRLLDAGAQAVQLYTAFVYEGPGVAGDIVRKLGRR